MTARHSLTTDQAQNRLTYKYRLGVLVLDYLIRAFHHYAEALRMPPLDGVLIESPYWSAFDEE